MAVRNECKGNRLGIRSYAKLRIPLRAPGRTTQKGKAMNGNLDLHLEQLAPTLPPIPPVNGAFTDPRQIAKTLRALYDENWQYIGTPHIGGHV